MVLKKSKVTDIELLTNLPVRVDYIFLKDLFKAYKSPKKKIFDLKERGFLYLIRRGQYFNLKSREVETGNYETIANSLYFPSYISLEWALQHYGLISDRVITVTSVTINRSKKFDTPLANFSYEHLNKKRYPIGNIVLNIKGGKSFLIARPEKALMDYVNLRAKNLKVSSGSDISEFLEEDLRLDINKFKKIVRLLHIQELYPFYHRNSKEHRILKWLIKEKIGLKS